MALIKCPECGREISDKAKACPNCGVPIAEKYQKKVRVIFSRPDKFRGSAVNGVVIIDNQRIGTINRGESFSVDLTVGDHRIELSANVQEKSGSVASSFFFGTPISTGGDRGSYFKTLTIKENYTSIMIVVDAAPGLGKGLEIVSITPRQ